MRVFSPSRFLTNGMSPICGIGQEKTVSAANCTPNASHGDGLVQDFHLFPLIGRYILAQYDFMCNIK